MILISLRISFLFLLHYLKCDNLFSNCIFRCLFCTTCYWFIYLLCCFEICFYPNSRFPLLCIHSIHIIFSSDTSFCKVSALREARVMLLKSYLAWLSKQTNNLTIIWTMSIFCGLVMSPKTDSQPFEIAPYKVIITHTYFGNICNWCIPNII